MPFVTWLFLYCNVCDRHLEGRINERRKLMDAALSTGWIKPYKKGSTIFCPDCAPNALNELGIKQHRPSGTARRDDV